MWKYVCKPNNHHHKWDQGRQRQRLKAHTVKSGRRDNRRVPAPPPSAFDLKIPSHVKKLSFANTPGNIVSALIFLLWVYINISLWRGIDRALSALKKSICLCKKTAQARQSILNNQISYLNFLKFVIDLFETGITRTLWKTYFPCFGFVVSLILCGLDHQPPFFCCSISFPCSQTLSVNYFNLLYFCSWISTSVPIGCVYLLAHNVCFLSQVWMERHGRPKIWLCHLEAWIQGQVIELITVSIKNIGVTILLSFVLFEGIVGN